MVSINVCVLGYGLSAKTFQIPYILLTPGLHLHSILQRTPTATNSAAADHPTAKIHNDFSAVLADAEIDLAIVSTANTAHYPMTKALLLAGKHVVVEKPFTVDHSQAVELIALAETHRRVLTVFQNRRWDADFLTLRRLLATNSLGTLISLTSHYDRYKPASAAQAASWKTQQSPGHGTLWDLGSHLIDQALQLFGTPTRVFGDIRDERRVSRDPRARWGEDGFADDAFDALLYYDRVVVRLSASTASLCERQLRYVARGSAAGWVKYGVDPQEGQMKGGMGPAEDGFGVEREHEWGVLTTAEEEGDGGITSSNVVSENGCYNVFFENLVRAVEGTAEVLVKPREAAEVIRIVELLGRSAKEGRVLDARAQ